MNQEAFEAACSVAIRDYHDIKQDGPLLVSLRANAVKRNDEWLIFPEYSAVLGAWPEARAYGFGGTYQGAEYHEEPAEAIKELVEQAKEFWQARQPQEVETDPERLKLDALLD